MLFNRVDVKTMYKSKMLECGVRVILGYRADFPLTVVMPIVLIASAN